MLFANNIGIKIAFQSDLIVRAAESGARSILLIAAGSALDLQAVWHHQSVRNCSIVLNDIDSGALQAAEKAFSELTNVGTGQLTYVVGNALESREQSRTWVRSI